MQRDLCAYLYDVIMALDAIDTFLTGVTFEKFRDNDLLRSGVERKFEICGEALSQASKFFPGSLDSVPDVSLIIGQRHWLAHGYFAIDPAKIWSAVENDVAALRVAVQQLLALHCPPV